MLVAIATENKAKVSACHTAFKKLRKTFKNYFTSEVHFISIAAQSSVAEMPLTLNELLDGARNRALFVYKKLSSENNIPEFVIGMEGGVFRTHHFNNHSDCALLQNWVYTYNGKTGFFGSSPGLPLPHKISRALYEQKRELAEVIDTISGKQDVRSNEGAFGILTENLLSRSEAFETAVINSIIPFLNTKYYL